MDSPTHPLYTVSVDEKPGVQAKGRTAPDLPPVPGQAPTMARDDESVRHGTVSILAGIDLHVGRVFAAVEGRYCRGEFIGWLQPNDADYPPEAIIRIVLDNPFSPLSKETTAHLATRPGRFEYVRTPQHGSWLNLIECTFHPIRVASVAELKACILKSMDKMNASPVVFRWKTGDLGIA